MRMTRKTDGTPSEVGPRGARIVLVRWIVEFRAGFCGTRRRRSPAHLAEVGEPRTLCGETIPDAAQVGAMPVARATCSRCRGKAGLEPC